METAAARPQSRQKRGLAFGSRKLFSFLGVGPLAVYVVWHLVNNVYAARGAAAFDARLARVNASPLYAPLVWIAVYIPFLVHAALGLAISWKGSANLAREPRFRNWKYVLQRVSAVGVLLFIPAHVYKTKIEPWMRGTTINFAHMREGMLEPLTFAVYVLAMLGVAFHLANGLWLAGLTWGVFVGPKAQRRAEWLSIVFGLAILGLAFWTLYCLRA